MLLLLMSFTVSAFAVYIATQRTLTSLEGALLQGFALVAGLVSSFIFGRQSATDAALMFKDKMEAEGIDLSGDTTRTGSSKGIASASQDSIDELNGRATVIQGHTFKMNGNVRDLRVNSDVIMNNVAEIAVNTRRLEGIEINLSALNKNVDDIMLKGIAIRNNDRFSS